MSKFEETNKTAENQEAHENHEAPKSVEKSAAEIGEQMIEQSEKEIAAFESEGEKELAQIEARAEEDGVDVDETDREELLILSEEAKIAEEEFFLEIGEKIIANTEDLEVDNNVKNIKEFKRDIGNLLESVVENKIKISSIYEEIDKIQQDIDLLQANSLKKIFNYFKIKKLSNERLTKEEQASLLISDTASAEQLITELIDQLEIKNKTEGVLIQAKEYFKNSPDRIAQINKIEKEREKRSVGSSMVRNNAFIFHGINDKKSGDVKEQESPLRQETAQDMRIKIAVALEPSLSTSSFRIDGSKQRLWSDVGLLVRGGYIDAAQRDDMHTKVVGINERENLKISTPSDIDRVMKEKRKTWDGLYWYNEIVVRNPKYAGLCVGSLKIDADIAKLTEELNMPIYYHDGNGHVFESSVQIAGDKYALTQGKEIFPADIVSSEYDISQEKRKDMIKHVVNDGIFHIDERMRDIEKL